MQLRRRVQWVQWAARRGPAQKQRWWLKPPRWGGAPWCGRWVGGCGAMRFAAPTPTGPASLRAPRQKAARRPGARGKPEPDPASVL